MSTNKSIKNPNVKRLGSVKKNEQAIHLIFDALSNVEDMNNLVPDNLLDEAGHKLYAAMNLLAEDMKSNVGYCVER